MMGSSPCCRPAVLFQSTTAEPDQMYPYSSGSMAWSICSQWTRSVLIAWPQVFGAWLMNPGQCWKEQMIFALVVDQAVGIAEPVLFAREVKLGTV